MLQVSMSKPSVLRRVEPAVCGHTCTLRPTLPGPKHCTFVDRTTDRGVAPSKIASGARHLRIREQHVGFRPSSLRAEARSVEVSDTPRYNALKRRSRPLSCDTFSREPGKWLRLLAPAERLNLLVF